MASVVNTDRNSFSVDSPLDKPARTLALAFCLYKYFPYGGLQRDFIRIARVCQSRGHRIRVYTLEWQGEIPTGFEVIIVPVESFTNHSRYEKYSRWVSAALRRHPVDGVIGINKMPGLDVYYAADSCYEEKAQSQRSWLYRLLPRYKHFALYEKSVFGNDCNTEVLMISEAQTPLFKKHYATPDSRLHFLPPGIARDRIAPDNAAEIRHKMREQLGVSDQQHLLMMIGSGFIKKGLRRALYALRSLPSEVLDRTRLFVVGEDNPAPFNRLILALGLRKQVVIMSGRDDVPALLLAADTLLHPAVDEAAGIILLEAIVAGLPVIATDICGYGHYVEEADVGRLISSPFQQEELNEVLLQMINEPCREQWQQNGKRFAEQADIYSLPEKACQIIESSILAKQVRQRQLAFCLFKYFPYGGLQRDFVRIAEQCQQQGCKIRVYTLSWQGPIPTGFEVVIVPVHAVTNHTLYRRFSEWLEQHLRVCPVDCVIGFNKMPGLDVYYAADGCYEQKAQTQRGALYRSIARYRHFSRFEKAVFDKNAGTEILMISEVQKPFFLKYYATQEQRFHLLPPGISRDRAVPEDSDKVRADLRQEFGVLPDEFLILLIGSGFITKGVDRLLLGVQSLPATVKEKTKVLIIGQDDPGSFQRMANRLGLKKRVRFLKGRGDIPRFLLAADLLVHPAYAENTGTVILEAIVSGLPVLATDVCGYAKYVLEADAGRLVPSPYNQDKFNELLSATVQSEQLPEWKINAINYAQHADIYSMPQQAAEFIVSKFR